MASCECLIIGGGPAGSSCAWALQRAGLDVTILDKGTFPRDKICGGWITPQVIEELEIDIPSYQMLRVIQPITGFRIACMGNRVTEAHYPAPVSYGIRRYEFDDYLVKRSGARLIDGVRFRGIERRGDSWLVNGDIQARIVVGAGGHFCPVARHLNPGLTGELAVVAQETEFELTSAQRLTCAIQGEVPELYFCRDLRGYGWCFRKGDFLNVGLGRLDSHQLSKHVADFVTYLRDTKRFSFDLPAKLLGHAYLLYSKTRRNLIADGILLVGDAAGLAYSQSGEGIRPAIESGLLAAKAILEANGDYSAAKFEKYRAALAERFGHAQEWSTRIGSKLPPRVMSSLGRILMAMPWFSRHVVIDNWFLHSAESAFESPVQVVAVP